MFLKSSLLKPIAVAALFVAAGASQAALGGYTSQASFLAVVTSPGVDTFAGFSITGTTASPLNRTAGVYGYRATASTAPFYGAGSMSDPWLSTNTATDSITFSNFTSPTSPVRAIGGNFFGSDINGLFLSGDITLVATDSTGATLSQTILGATTTSFVGFVTFGTATLTSLVVSASQTVAPVWPTVDNLTLAVPEAQTYAMMLAGLGVLGVVARRRRG